MIEERKVANDLGEHDCKEDIALFLSYECAVMENRRTWDSECHQVIPARSIVG